MSEGGKSGSVTIWVALIGALVSSGGYLFAYYKDLAIQDRKQNHDLVIRLLTEDARESSRNLIWAHDAGLISLRAETVRALEEKPYEGPTVSSGDSPAGGAIDELIPSQDIVALVRGLDAPTKSVRSRALQTLLDDAMSDDAKLSEAVAASIAALSGSRLDELSANGRYNILYFLNRVDWRRIGEAQRDRMQGALDQIAARAREGLAAVGPQTNSLMENVTQKLAEAGGPRP